MNSTEIRVLLIVQDESSRNKYLEALSGCDVRVYVSSSFQNMDAEICTQSFHGIFLDLPTKIKALKQNKYYVYGLLEYFPVAQLRYNEKTGQISCFYSSQENGGSMADFIRLECRNVVPRMLRSDTRKDIHFNVRIFRTPEDVPLEHTATINISKGGCFLFSVRPWRIDDDVWLEFMELSRNRFLHGRIRRIVPWGESKQIPGIGIEFLDITESQLAEIFQE